MFKEARCLSLCTRLTARDGVRDGKALPIADPEEYRPSCAEGSLGTDAIAGPLPQLGQHQVVPAPKRKRSGKTRKPSNLSTIWAACLCRPVMLRLPRGW